MSSLYDKLVYLYPDTNKTINVFFSYNVRESS